MGLRVLEVTGLLRTLTLGRVVFVFLALTFPHSLVCYITYGIDLSRNLL